MCNVWNRYPINLRVEDARSILALLQSAKPNDFTPDVTRLATF